MNYREKKYHKTRKEKKVKLSIIKMIKDGGGVDNFFKNSKFTELPILSSIRDDFFDELVIMKNKKQV